MEPTAQVLHVILLLIVAAIAFSIGRQARPKTEKPSETFQETMAGVFDSFSEKLSGQNDKFMVALTQVLQQQHSSTIVGGKPLDLLMAEARLEEARLAGIQQERQIQHEGWKLAVQAGIVPPGAGRASPPDPRK
jgi:hypothetical protein